MIFSPSKTAKDQLVKTISKNSFFTLLYHSWYLGSRLLLTPVLLTYLSIEEFGLWGFCFLILGYLGVTAVGFNGTYIKYTAEYMARAEKDKVNDLITTGLVVMGTFSLVTLPLLYFFLPYILSLLGIEQEYLAMANHLFFGTAFVFILNFSLGGFQGILEGEQRIDLVRKIQLTASVIEIVAILVFFNNGVGIYSLLWAYAIRVIVIAGLSIWFAYKVFPFLTMRFGNFKKETLKIFFRFGTHLQIISFLSLLMNSLDRIFISRLLPLDSLGLYEAGRKLPNCGLMLSGALSGTLMPVVAHLGGNQEKQRVSQVYLMATRYLMILTAIPFAFLMFFTPQLIYVWLGNGYIQVATIAQVLALGTLVNLFTGIGTACVKGNGKPVYEIKYLMLAVTCNLALIYPMTSHLGIIGAAWAYTLSQIVGSIYFLILANRLFEVSWDRFTKLVIMPVAGLFLLCVPLIYFVGWQWTEQGMTRWHGLGVLSLAFLGYLVLIMTVSLLCRNIFLDPVEKKWLGGFKIFPKLKIAGETAW